jgi:hypothetical protein
MSFVEVLATAVASAVLTTVLLAWWAGRVLLPKLEQRLEARLDGILATAGSELGAEVGRSVGAELEEFATNQFPRLRQEVRAGFADAMSGALRGELIAPTAKSAVLAGAGVVGKGLDLLLGSRPAPAPDPDDEDT